MSPELRNKAADALFVEALLERKGWRISHDNDEVRMWINTPRPLTTAAYPYKRGDVLSKVTAIMAAAAEVEAL